MPVPPTTNLFTKKPIKSRPDIKDFIKPKFEVKKIMKI